MGVGGGRDQHQGTSRAREELWTVPGRPGLLESVPGQLHSPTRRHFRCSTVYGRQREWPYRRLERQSLGFEFQPTRNLSRARIQRCGTRLFHLPPNSLSASQSPFFSASSGAGPYTTNTRLARRYVWKSHVLVAIQWFGFAHGCCARPCFVPLRPQRRRN